MHHVRKRRVIWILAAVGVATVAVPWSSRLFRTDRVTRANYDRIHVGMTLEEVKAILAEPWKDALFEPAMPLSTLVVNCPGDFVQHGEFIAKERVEWLSGQRLISVVFDQEWKVGAKQEFDISKLPKPSFVRRLWGKAKDWLVP